MGQSKNGRRSGVGYGSSYRSGTAKDLSAGAEIGSVLGGQVWMVKPDKEARTSNPCMFFDIWMFFRLNPFFLYNIFSVRKKCVEKCDCTVGSYTTYRFVEISRILSNFCPCPKEKAH